MLNVNNNQDTVSSNYINEKSFGNNMEVFHVIESEQANECKIDDSVMYKYLDADTHINLFINPFDKEAINKLKEEIAGLQKAARKVK